MAPQPKAAPAVGADGLIVEVHPRPEEARCDGAQSLTPAEFSELVRSLARYAELESLTLSTVPPPAPSIAA